MRYGFAVAAALLLSVYPNAAVAKESSIGIYAVISDVTFNHNGRSPNRVRISGVFVVPTAHSSGEYRAPQRGWLYFRIPRDAEQAARKELSRLKASAGTGEVVGFAFYWVPNPKDPFGNPHHSLEVRVRNGADAAPPDVYPLAHPAGVVRSGNRDDFDVKIAEELRNLN